MPLPSPASSLRQLETASDPVAPKERVWAIDALRGLALFGVLAINLDTEFRATVFEQFLAPPPAPAFDRAAAAFLSFAFEFKAISLFSMLFGIGLAIQHDRFRRRPQGTKLLVRRLLALLAFGLIHLFLIWNGDILTEYALAGFVILPLLFAPAWALLPAAAALMLVYAGMGWIPLPYPFPDAAWLAQHVREARHVYSSGSFFDILRLRIAEVPQIAKLHVYIFPRTLALMLFGVWLWRSDAIGRMRARAGTTLAAGIVLVGAGLVLTAQEKGYFTLFPLAPSSPLALQFAHALLTGLAPVTTALGYAALVFAASASRKARSTLQWAVPAGRTAFSNYIGQSLILGLLFYGYGLKLMGHADAATGIGMAIALYAAQAGFSAVWLRSHRFGPLEWLWRSLTYGRRQPWLRERQSAPCTQSANETPA